MDGGSVEIDVTVDPGGVRRGMQSARAEIRQTQQELRGIQKQISEIEQMRARVPADVFGRSFYAKDLVALKAQRAELQGIVNAERQATQAAQQRSRTLGGMVGRGGLRSAGVAGAVGIGAYLVGQNLQELGGEGTPANRAGGFLSNLVSGNVVGAIKAAQEQVKLTDDQVAKLAATGSLAGTEFDKLRSALDLKGGSEGIYQVADALKEMGALTDEQVRKVRELRAEINAGYALQSYQQSSIGYAGAPVMPNDRGGMLGVGAANAVVPSAAAAFDPKGTLNLFRRQQTALASTTPGKGDDIAETRRNIAYLERLKKDVRIQGQARTNLYQEIAQQQQTLAALTAKPPPKAPKEPPVLPPGLEMRLAKARTTIGRTDDDLRELRRVDAYLDKAIEATKSIDRKTKLLERQGQTRSEIDAILQGQQGTTTNIAVNAASVLGGLGQGPFLTSPVAQFAQGFGFKPRARDYLRDIRSQVQAGTKLDRQLGMLRKRGASDQLIGELAGQGLGAADLVNALAKGPASLVRQYSRAAEKREEVAARVQTLTAEIQTANIVIRNGTVTGIDRNGDGKITGSERFTSGPADR